jgi:uncharacterized RDD family membrane protein YckC
MHHERMPLITKLATPHERFVAKMTDWGIVVIPVLTLFYTYGRSPYMPEPQLWVAATLASMFTGLLIIIFLQWVLIGTRGQSLGKIVMRIKVVDEKTKKTGGFVQNLVLRTWLPIIMWENIIFLLCDTLLIYRKERRCLHDYLAGTIVVKAK